MIQKATLKDVPMLQDSRFAPYVGETVFIIDRAYLIFPVEEEIVTDFDVEYYRDIFEINEYHCRHPVHMD